MPYLLIIIGLVPFGLAINYLITRYRYSHKSRTLLLLLWLLSYLVGLGFMRYSFPGIEPAYIYAGALGFSLPLFVGLAAVAVLVLRSRLLRGFDQEIRRLDVERDKLHGVLALTEERLALARTRRRAVEGRNREKLGEQRILQHLLEEWQQAGGVARLRAVKIQEWRQELDGLGRADLEVRLASIHAEIERLNREGKGGSVDAGERLDQLRAQVKVVELALLQPELSDPNQELAELDKSIADLEVKKQEQEAALEATRRDLDEWRGRRSEFLSRQITLG